MKKILLSLLAVVILTACSKSDDESTKVFSNFATLDLVTGNGAILTVQNPGEDQSYTLTASQTISADNFSVGKRVFIQYSTPTNESNTSGTCSLYGMYNTEGGGAEIQGAAAEATKNWESGEVQLTEVTVTGSYLNIIGMALGESTKYNCQLYVDAETLNDEYPQLHLVFTNEGVAEQYLTLLGSWNFEYIRQLPTSKGMIFNANNPGLQSIRIEF